MAVCKKDVYKMLPFEINDDSDMNVIGSLWSWQAMRKKMTPATLQQIEERLTSNDKSHAPSDRKKLFEAYRELEEMFTDAYAELTRLRQIGIEETITDYEKFPKDVLSANIATPDMMAHLQPGGHKTNIPALKNAVERLCLAATQKTSGQRKDNNVDNSVNFQSPEIPMIQFIILCEAVTLVLSGVLDKLEGDG